MAVICSLVVTPIILYLPINLSKRDKFILIGISFVLAIGGMVTIDYLSYWMSIAIFLCLAFTAAYVSEKWIPVLPTNAREEFASALHTIQPVFSRDDNRMEQLEIEEALAPSFEETVQNGEELNDEIPIQIEDSFLLEDVLVDDLEVTSVDLVLEDVSEEEVVVENDLLLSLEELQKQEDEFEFLEINRSDLIDLNSEENSEFETIDEMILERAELFEEFDETELETELEKEIEIELAVAEVEEIEREDSVKELEEIEHLDISEISLESVENSIEKELVISEVEPINDREIIIEPEIISEELNDVSPLDMDVAVQDMLLHTLSHYRAQQDFDSYHSMLLTILEEPLSNKDYYLFAKLLVESFLATNYATGAKAILQGMDERLSDYPIIQEEVKHYLSSLD
jgi:hypothetical protein